MSTSGSFNKCINHKANLLRNCFQFSLAHCRCSARLKQLDIQKEWKYYKWSNFLNGKRKPSLWQCRTSTSLLFLPLSIIPNVQFSSVAQSCPTLCNSMDCSMPGFPVYHQLQELALTHVHWAGNAIQPSHPLSSPSPPAPNPSQHQGLCQWINSSHEVAKVLEFQLQHQSFQWTPRTDLL